MINEIKNNMKRVVVIFLILIFPVGVFAQSATQDYKVSKGETLYGLSQKYNTTVAHLLDLNPFIINNNLQEGATIKVPVLKNDANYNKVKIGPPQFIVPVTYNIGKGETLYSIAKKMNTNVESLRMWNELKNDNIKAGQKLIVGYGNSNIENVVVNENKTKTTVETKKTEPVKNTSKDVVKTNKETSAKDSKKVVEPKDDTLVKKQDNTSVSVIKTTGTGTKTDSYAVVDNKKPTTTNGSTTVVEKNPVTGSTTVVSNPGTTKTNDNSAPETNSKTTTVTTVKTNSPVADKTLTYLTEKGVITWTKSNNDDGQFYALHPTAPIGTTITVKNMMNSKTIQVKVIGKLPNTADNQGVLMKISNSAAKALNVLDDKFLSTANYMGYKAE